MTTQTFTTLSGFTKAYAEARGSILEAHGYAADAKGVRLAPGMIVMEMQSGDNWIGYTRDMPEAKDRVRLNRRTPEPATFRLRVR